MVDNFSIMAEKVWASRRGMHLIVNNQFASCSYATSQIVLSQEPVDPEVSSVTSASRAPSVLSTDSMKLTSQTKIVPRK